MIGGSQGGNVETATSAVADVLDVIQGKPTPQQLETLEAKVNSIPPDVQATITVELARIEAEREQNRLNYDLGMHESQQKTIRTSPDVSGMRPRTAERAFYLTFLYVVGFEAGEAFGYGLGASFELAGLFISPTLAYFGFRTFDRFSKQGATQTNPLAMLKGGR
jgi:hypothetical protein